jgi:hypothetical protein
MDQREQFVKELEQFIRSFDGHDDELHAELAVLASLGAFACIGAAEVMLAAVTPLTRTLMEIHQTARAKNN